MERFVERARALRVGDPLDETTEMGSLISPEHRERVDGYVRRGVQQGARLCTGGRVLHGGLYDRCSFYEPAVFRGVTPDMEIARRRSSDPWWPSCRSTRRRRPSASRTARSTASRAPCGRATSAGLRVARAVKTGVISVNSSWA